MIFDALAFAGFGLLALALAYAGAGRIAPWVPPRLLVLAVALRIVGSTARYEVLFRFYGGYGDAVLYFHKGRELAAQLLEQPSLLFSPHYWASGYRWWGTPFLEKVSGVLLTVTGPSMRAGFLVFSLLSFAGLLAIALAFRNTQPGPRAVQYAAWMWLWPSLWFWPSSIGKEAILVLAIGLTVLGYARSRGGINWPLFLAGLGLTFCIRPHVALVLAMATLIAHWLGSWGRLSLRRLAEAAVAVVLCAVAFVGMRAQFGLEDAGFEGMKEFVQYRTDQTLQGGSNIGGVPLGAAGIPMAFVNVWMRPFPWEAHNATSLFAALEIAAFWFLVWRRRKAVGFSIRKWRRHRLLRFGVPFLFLYTLMIGIAFGNLGIIARQRAPIFPFMLMMLAAAPVGATSAARRRAEEVGPAFETPRSRARRAATASPAAAVGAPATSGAAEGRRQPPPVKIQWMPAPSGDPPAEAT